MHATYRLYIDIHIDCIYNYQLLHVRYLVSSLYLICTLYDLSLNLHLRNQVVFYIGSLISEKKSLVA